MRMRFLIINVVGALIPVILPCLHLGLIYRWWTSYKRKVDTELCSCSCWDTVFKGTYEETDVTGYKHLYFNVTWQSFLIWFITVVFVILLYECTRYLLVLACDGKLCHSMMLAAAVSVYPHYYAWWMYVNAWNDDFYEQFYHQALFSFTEICSTFLILPMCNKSRPVEPRRLLIVFVIALVHVMASAYDQFVKNVLWRLGDWHQFARDVSFMASDFITLFVAVFKLRDILPNAQLSLLRTINYDETMIVVFFILVFGFLVVFL